MTYTRPYLYSLGTELVLQSYAQYYLLTCAQIAEDGQIEDTMIRRGTTYLELEAEHRW